MRLKLTVTCSVLILFFTLSENISATGFNFYAELDQMLSTRIGCEYGFTDTWALKGSAGVSPFMPTIVTCNLLGVYTLPSAGKWNFDLEGGLPLAYFDQIEGRYFDNDPYIDDPYAGWLFGFSVLISHEFFGSVLGLRLGAAEWIEQQQKTGWKGPQIMPIVAIVWDF